MANILKITGRNVDLIYTNTGMRLGLDLLAHYQDTQYHLSIIGKDVSKECSKAAVALYFSREDGKYVPDGLNDILLATNCEGDYEAIGICRFNDAPAKGINVECYDLGNDLKIDVDSNIDDIIRSIPRLSEEKYPGNTPDDLTTKENYPDDFIAS